MMLASPEKGENKAKNRGVNTVLSPRSYKALTSVMTGSI